MSDILVGTSAWTDKTLLQTDWYPKEAKSAEDRLRYYASQFPITEVDSSYYFPPSEKNSELWVERTPKSFTFNVKAFSSMTGHPTKADAIYKDLEVPVAKKNLYPEDLKPEVIDAIWERFTSALWPLHEAGKLGALLFQFPPWFVIGKKNRNYILDCARRAAPMRICVEFRNKTWMSQDNRDETLSFLEGHGLAYVCVDMPQGFTSSIPPVVAATTDLAVVRMHGRNESGWEAKTVHERFRYNYDHRELGEWVERVAKLADGSEETHVIMNNCYRDYAQQNASELAGLLKAQGAPVLGPA